MPVAVVYLEQDGAYPSPEWIGLFKDQAAALAHTHSIIDAHYKFKRAVEAHVQARAAATKEYLLRNRQALKVGNKFHWEDDPAAKYVEEWHGEIASVLDEGFRLYGGDRNTELERWIHLDQLREPLPHFVPPRWEDYDDGNPRREGCNFYYFPCEERG